MIYVQAKRWQNPISPRTVREGIGALEDAGAKKATTSRFSAEAQQLADMASACG